MNQLMHKRRSGQLNALAIGLALSFLLGFASKAHSEDWPQWRGPTGQGLVHEKGLPTTWSAKTGENIAWKAPLPKGDTPYSSPIVVGGKVIVTIAINAGREHHVICFDAKDGKQLWDTPVPAGPWVLSDLRGGYAACTPAADSERFYALFGSAVLVALDHSGKILWRHELANYAAFDVAIGCSPILFGENVIVQADTTKKQSAMLALDRKTGAVKWESKRPEVGFAHSTPTLIELGGKPHLLVAASDALQGVDPASGKVEWWTKAKGDTVSPVFSKEARIAYIDSGRGGAAFAVAVAPGLTGDVTKAQTKWTIKQVPEAFGSPVIVGQKVYRLHSPGVLKVWNLTDGTEVMSQRLEGVTAAASPVVSEDGLIYFASSGISFIVKAGDKPEVIPVGDLGDSNYASPAVANGAIYLKGRKFLWCVRAK